MTDLEAFKYLLYLNTYIIKQFSGLDWTVLCNIESDISTGMRSEQTAEMHCLRSEENKNLRVFTWTVSVTMVFMCLHPCEAPLSVCLSVCLCLNPCNNWRTADWTFMKSDIREIYGNMYCHFKLHLEQTVLMMNCRSFRAHKRLQLYSAHDTLLYSTVRKG